MVAIEIAIEDCTVEFLPCESLSQQCSEQVSRYRRGESCDDSFTFELFRRAVVKRDERAWLSLHAIFNDQMQAWCRLTSCDRSLDADDLASVAWERFWLYFTPAKLDAANGAPGILRYLKMCARSATIDAARAQLQTVSLDLSPVEEADRDPSPADAHADADRRGRFWAIVNGTLRDDSERVLAHLVYERGLKSSEVQARHSDLFPTVGDVYRVTRNVLDRLKRNRALLDWFTDECR
jgi:hypothetical protein